MTIAEKLAERIRQESLVLICPPGADSSVCGVDQWAGRYKDGSVLIYNAETHKVKALAGSASWEDLTMYAREEI